MDNIPPKTKDDLDKSDKELEERMNILIAESQKNAALLNALGNSENINITPKTGDTSKQKPSTVEKKKKKTRTAEDIKIDINAALEGKEPKEGKVLSEGDDNIETLDINLVNEKKGLTQEEEAELNKLLESKIILETKLSELLAEKEKASQPEGEEEEQVNIESQKFINKLNNAKKILEEKIKSITWYKPLVSVKDSAFLVCNTYTDSSLYKGSTLRTKNALEETIKEIDSSIKYTEKTIAEGKIQIKKDKEEIAIDREKNPFLYYAVENSNSSAVLDAYKKKSFVDLRTIEDESEADREWKYLNHIDENEGEGYFNFNLFGFVKVIKNIKEVTTTEGKIGSTANNVIYKIIGPNNEIVADDIHGYDEATKIYKEKTAEYKKKLLEQFEKDLAANKNKQPENTKINEEISLTEQQIEENKLLIQTFLDKKPTGGSEGENIPITPTTKTAEEIKEEIENQLSGNKLHKKDKKLKPGEPAPKPPVTPEKTEDMFALCSKYDQIMADRLKNGKLSERMKGNVLGGLTAWENYGQNEQGVKGFKQRMTKTAVNLALIGAISMLSTDVLIKNTTAATAAVGASVASRMGIKMAFGLGLGSIADVAGRGEKMKKIMPFVMGTVGVVLATYFSGLAAVGAVAGASALLGYHVSKNIKGFNTKEKLTNNKENEREELLKKYRNGEGTIDFSRVPEFEKEYKNLIKKYENEGIWRRLANEGIKLVTASAISVAVIETSAFVRTEFGHNNPTTINNEEKNAPELKQQAELLKAQHDAEIKAAEIKHQAEVKAAEIKHEAEQIKIATVHAGGSYERSFIHQIENEHGLAEKLGYKGDLNDTKALHEFAGVQAGKIAFHVGIVDNNGNQLGIAEADKIAPIIKIDNTGHVTVEDHTLDGKIITTHHEGDKFGESLEKHEYLIKQHEVKAEELKPDELPTRVEKMTETPVFVSEQTQVVEHPDASLPFGEHMMSASADENPTSLHPVDGHTDTKPTHENTTQHTVNEKTNTQSTDENTKQQVINKNPNTENKNVDTGGKNSTATPVSATGKSSVEKNEINLKHQDPIYASEDKTPTHPTVEYLSHHAKSIYEHNTDKIFPNDESQQVWNDLKNLTHRFSAEKLMQTKMDETSSIIKPLLTELHKLQEITGLKPRPESLLVPAESPQEYRIHAYHVAQQMGKLHEVKDIKF